MNFRNSEFEYGSVTKAFHWITALVVIGLIIVGLTMEDYPLSIKLTAYNLHKSFGILVLFLILARIVWHFSSHTPQAVETLKPSEKFLSKALHYSFYALLIAMPLTGWIFSSYGGRPVNVFGLFILPDLVSQDKEMGKLFKEAHEIIGYLIMAGLALHVAAAFKHHLIDKDRVLRRMLPLAVFLAFLLPAPTHADGADAVRKWNVLRDQSSITFRPKQMGTEFKGTFGLYKPDIAFDPDNLAASKVIVEIDLASAHTQAPDRDEALKGKDWFDVTQFPAAKFETTAFRKTGDKTFEADATVTIRNISVSITLPFTLDITKRPVDGDKAVVDGTVTLDRSKFQLGIGQWVDTSVIANEVPIDIHITAVDANP